MSSVRAVFFDLDDTLFDHSFSADTALQALRAQYAAFAARGLDELRVEYARLLEAVHARVLSGQISLNDARLERLRRLARWCGWEVSAEEAEAVALLQRGANRDARRPVPGVIPLLEHLRGRATVGVVTNNITAEQEEKLRCCKLDGLIDFLVTSEDTGYVKPQPEIFRLALQRAGCGPDEAVMIGDSWRVDVLGAHAAGIRAMWLNRTGVPCPDSSLAREIRSFEPVEDVLDLIWSSAS